MNGAVAYPVRITYSAHLPWASKGRSPRSPAAFSFIPLLLRSDHVTIGAALHIEGVSA